MGEDVIGHDEPRVRCTYGGILLSFCLYYSLPMLTEPTDRTVKIFDVSANQHSLSATLTGHEGPVWEVAWAHPKFGTVLASCSFDGTVMIHRETRPRVWTLLYTHRFHASSVNSVEFTPHEFGLVLACASSDGKVSILTHQPDDTWDVEHFKDNALGVNSLSWGHFNCLGSKAEGQPESAPQMRLVTGGCDNRIRFWRYHAEGNGIAGGWKQDQAEALGDGVAHSDWVRDVAWMPSRVPQNTVASCSEDHTVIIWTQTQAGGMWQPTLLNSFEAPVWRLSWSVNGSILAVSSGDNTVTLWKSGLDGVWKQVSTMDDDSAAPPAPPQM
jgi:protein transport protein SEC13